MVKIFAYLVLAINRGLAQQGARSDENYAAPRLRPTAFTLGFENKILRN